MLISDLIQKLKDLQTKSGDIPIYWKDDFTIYPVSGVWVETIDDDEAEDNGLEVGDSITCLG